MTVWEDLKSGIRQIILMESRIDDLAKKMDRLTEHSLDHEKRLVRIETLIEVAQERRVAATKWLE